MNKEIIVDVIVSELKKLGYVITPEKKCVYNETSENYKKGFFVTTNYLGSKTTLPKGKNLLTEYDVKQYLKKCGDNKKEIIVPENTIIGPLAEELINNLGIKVIKKKI